jgi:phage terminase large subunit-like protein
MVNPNHGRSIMIQRLVEDFRGAEAAGEAELRRWASQHLNAEIGLALASSAWTAAKFWEARADRSLTLEALLDRSDVVTIGLDGGGLDDLLGLAVLGRDAETREWLLWAHAWVSRSALEVRKAIAERLRDFERAGELTIVDDLGQDIVELADMVDIVAQSGRLPERGGIGLDPAGLGLIIEELAAHGIDVTPEAGIVVGVSQGWKLTGAIKTVERKLADHSLTHAGQALMAWNVSNAKVEPRGNAIMITKQAAGVGKIDCLMATFNSVAIMTANPARSEYDGALMMRCPQR